MIVNVIDRKSILFEEPRIPSPFVRCSALKLDPKLLFRFRAALDRSDQFGSKVTLRRGPSDFGCDPMISPALCPISFTALKSKFSPRPMAFAVG
ncbi:hypothetical protein, partial [Roseovarius autotrophicus]|uniref:hypothetical protein n=1 Tax=Roseovarius autotrophicus TaxID=2824121 RepID=UPI001B387884